MATENEKPAGTDADRELLKRFSAHGDQCAFESLVRRHCPLVLGVSRRVLGDAHDAEDVMQATFAVLAKNAGRIRSTGSLASWLYKVAHRISLRQLRERISLKENTTAEPMIDDDSPLERLAKRSDEETADEELRRMPERYRGPLVLHYLEERSYQEIADELGISLSAVAGRIKRGRADLRRRLLRRGITLSGFVAIVSSSQPSMAQPAIAALVQSVVANSIAFARGNMAADVTSHHLAQLEHLQMMLPLTKAASFAAIALVAIGFGSLAVSFVAAQPSHDRSESVQTLPAESSAGSIWKTTTAAFETGSTDAQANAGQTGPAQSNTAALRYREVIEGIESQLDRPAQDFAYLGESLSDVVADFAARFRIPIFIDAPALEDVGISTDTPISIQIAGVSARSALRLILDANDLAYVIANESIMITTMEEEEARQDTRVYDVGATGIPSEKLMELIMQTVEDDSWSLIGGPGEIAAATPTLLVIAQSQRVHEQVTDLLGQLQRKAK